ncbi:MAG: pyruvate kinase [Candidatus Latescibacterota bacterium]|nr:pyruvate kinase [Candidatus Latescibacterota bacterium]
MRRAKIVCTIGPASRSLDVLRALVDAGMDVARLNFSHGSHADHAAVVADLRRVADEAGRPLAILQDLQGPKIRLGTLQGGAVQLSTGARFVLTTEEIEGDAGRASTTYKALPSDVMQGDDILLSDGLLRLRVDGVNGEDITCTVVDGGHLRQRAGINLPGAELSVPSMTEKDLADLAFGVEQGVDWVALSFVRSAADVDALKAELARLQADAGVIAKLEKPQAIDALDAIVDTADAIMVARGDLGVEMSPERVPFIQKTIIRACAAAGKPVITATQMLESMIENPRPTRAEASDVANAVFDGTDAVMLSGETAMGAHPIHAVQMMHRIVSEAERNVAAQPEMRRRARREAALSFSDAIAEAAGQVAADTKAAAIVAFTQSGFSAKLIARSRPQTRIYAFTPHRRVQRRLCAHWGLEPRHAAYLERTQDMIEVVEQQLLEEGIVRAGDSLVFLAGMPSNRPGTTNMLRLHTVGDEVR